MITEFFGANGLRAKNLDAAVTRLVLGADIGIPESISFNRSKVLVFDGWQFIKGTVTAFTNAVDPGPPPSGKTKLTVNYDTGFAAGQTVAIKGSNVSAYNKNDWEVDSVTAGFVTLKMPFSTNPPATGELILKAGSFTTFSVAATADNGFNTTLTVSSTAGIAVGKTITIYRSTVTSYDGEWTVLSIAGSSVKIAMLFNGTASGALFQNAPGTPIITFDGYLAEGREKVFDNFAPGDIKGTFGRGEVYPEWWGLQTDYHDRAINAALNTFSIDTQAGKYGNRVSLGAGEYKVSAPLDMRAGYCRLEGVGSSITRIASTKRWAPSLWEDSKIFTYFTTTEAVILQTASHSALLWIGSVSGSNSNSWGSGVRGIWFDGSEATKAHPFKHVSIISSTGYVEENSIIEDVVCNYFSGFGIGFHNAHAGSTINGLTIRDFWITASSRRNSIPLFIPPNAANCTVSNGTIDVGVSQPQSYLGSPRPDYAYDWPTCGMVVGGLHTSINSIHLEGMCIGIYVMATSSPSFVTISNVDGWTMMDYGMVHTASPRAAGPAPSLAVQAAPVALTRRVKGATNAAPIVVETDTPHGLTTGSSVVIGGVGGNRAANGLRSIQYVDDTHFSLDGSTGDGVYTAGTGFVKSKRITNATNNNPIVVTCTAHGLKSGSSGVAIAGVQGNTAANGTWTVTVVDENTFSLNGSAGNGNYSSNSDGTMVQVITGATSGKVISTASNATPIVITTTNNTPHGLKTGVSGVVISGVLGNANANGTWQITRLSDTAFSLNGSVGIGSGTGGTITPPIMITYSNHGFSTGDTGVIIANVSGNTAANSSYDATNKVYVPWASITVIDAESFVLDGSTPNGDFVQSHGVIFADAPTQFSYYRRHSSVIVIGGEPNNFYSASSFNSSVIAQNITTQGLCKYLLRDHMYGIEFSSYGRGEYPNKEYNGFTSYQRANAWLVAPGAYGYTPKPITTASAETPILITAVGHGLSTGQLVVISGVQNNTNANNWWFITVTGPDTFTLNGSGSTIAGTGGKVSSPTALLITDVVGNVGQPIKIKCIGHGLLTGASGVIISGVLGNTAANGVWTITRDDADNFTLNSSSANGVYSSGGIVIGPDYRTSTYNINLPATDKNYFAGEVNFQLSPPRFIGPMY